MNELSVNSEILRRSAAGWWMAVSDRLARLRERQEAAAAGDQGGAGGVGAGGEVVPVLPAWTELPAAVQAAIQMDLCDSVMLSALGYSAPRHDHFVLERIWRWCEAINLRGLVCEAKTSFHRHKVYGKTAAVIMEMAADEGLIVHLGHLVIVLARYQARGEKPITEQDLIAWKREPVVRALREQWHEDLGLMREAMVAAEQGKAGMEAKERRAV